MGQPGVWVFGETDARQRAAGAGIVVEYANAKAPAVWNEPPKATWGVLAFASSTPTPDPVVRIPIVIDPGVDGNLWAINGKSSPRLTRSVSAPASAID